MRNMLNKLKYSLNVAFEMPFNKKIILINNKFDKINEKRVIITLLI